MTRTPTSTPRPEALRQQHAKPNGADVKFTPEQWEEIQRLLDLNPIDRDNQIEASAGNLGCLLGTLRKTLNGLLRKKNGDDGDTNIAGKPGAGQTLNIPKIELWPSAVDGASPLDEIAATVRRFVVTRESVPEAVALWALHTHALAAAFITPRLAVTSPERQMRQDQVADPSGRPRGAAAVDGEHHAGGAVSRSRHGAPDAASGVGFNQILRRSRLNETRKKVSSNRWRSAQARLCPQKGRGRSRLVRSLIVPQSTSLLPPSLMAHRPCLAMRITLTIRPNWPTGGIVRIWLVPHEKTRWLVGTLTTGAPCRCAAARR
jgi:hypothetical protein